MTEKLFAILLAYHATRVPERYRHESEDARQSRIHTIAESQVAECAENPIPGWPDVACVALGTTIMQWESGLLLEVHSGKLRGPAGEGCLFQLHRFATAIPDSHYRITVDEIGNSMGIDLDNTRNCVRLGMRILRWHIHRCNLHYEGGGWAAVAQLFAEYHHPSVECRAVILPMSTVRALSYQHLLRRLGG